MLSIKGNERPALQAELPCVPWLNELLNAYNWNALQLSFFTLLPVHWTVFVCYYSNLKNQFLHFAALNDGDNSHTQTRFQLPFLQYFRSHNFIMRNLCCHYNLQGNLISFPPPPKKVANVEFASATFSFWQILTFLLACLNYWNLRLAWICLPKLIRFHFFSNLCCL